MALSGCIGGAEKPEGASDVEAEKTKELQVLADTTLDWPLLAAMGPETFTFEISEGTDMMVISFNWRGQQPGGYSADRSARAIAPDGSSEVLYDGDLPVNPYACANELCGPADARVLRVAGPAAGIWTIELGGAYTGTAYILVETA